MGKPTELLQGTLDMLILKTLALDPMHGWGITVRVQQITGEVLQVRPGALYPALHGSNTTAGLVRNGAPPPLVARRSFTR